MTAISAHFPQAPYERPLADSLVLRSADDTTDVERLAAFNGHIHGPGVALCGSGSLRCDSSLV